MKDDLYFVPEIARAIEDEMPERALRLAFQRIVAQGRRRGFAAGYSQFLCFMRTVRRHHDRTADQRTSSVLEAVAKAFILRAIKKPPPAAHKLEPLKEYHELWTDLYHASNRPAVRELFVEREGERVSLVTLSPAPTSAAVMNVAPGHFALRLETGMVLWEHTLTANHTHWRMAFPGQPMSLAADAGESRPRHSYEEVLLRDSLVLRVFPGLEAGLIAIIWRGNGSLP